ncbi:MAG: hypothetical protein GMKNLPBB_02086 [Myxococcota bacterium]|nr:hypothetical protein [Myxococcota bacterium]
MTTQAGVSAFRALLIAVLAFAALGGCSMKTLAIRSTAEVMKDGLKSFEDEEDYELAAAAAPGNLKLIEALLSGDPDNEELQLMASRAFASVAFGFLETEMEELKDKNEDRYEQLRYRAQRYYLRSREYGMRILKKHYPIEKALEGPLENLEAVLREVDRDDAPALFWAGYAWGSYINLARDNMDALGDLPRVNAMMKRALELDETYFNGGPHLFFGVMKTSLPPTLGGKPDEGREHFAKVDQITGGKLLLAKVMFARFYAVGQQDEKLFDQTLDAVLEAPDDILPGNTLMTRVAKKRAAIWKARKGEYF